jgi:hypothetical protein
MKWKAPEPDAPDPAGAREEAALYTDLADSLRTWARSWPGSSDSQPPQAHGPEREASHDEPEAGS